MADAISAAPHRDPGGTPVTGMGVPWTEALDRLVSLVASYSAANLTTRDGIVAEIRDMPDGVIFPVLEKALRDESNADLRNSSMELYRILGGRSIPPLIGFLDDPDEDIRAFACLILGPIGHRAVVPHLVRSLSDPDMNVKHAAAEALGRIGDPVAVPPLISALGSDPWLQYPAVVALGEIADDRAVEPLIRLLDQEGINVPAISSLGRIGHRQALAPLTRFLAAGTSSFAAWVVESMARILLKNRGDAPALPLPGEAEEVLLDLLSSDSAKTRRNATVVAGYARVERAVPKLIGLLGDPDLRNDAIEALAHIRSWRADDLASALRDSDAKIRMAAVEALAGLGDPDARRLLESLKTDPDEGIRSLVSNFLTPPKGPPDAPLSTAPSPLPAGGEAAAVEAPPLGGIVPFRDLIAERFGLYYDDERLNVLRHRLSTMATIEGFATLREYLRAVEDDPRSAALLQRLASHLTNNESYFFRELDQLALLVKLVGGHPSVPAARHRRRILSAGCSTGEEPYSIAVMLADAGLLAPAVAPEIVGLDIDRRALALAREGVYPARSMRGGMPGRISGRHIVAEGDRLRIHDDVRASVAFLEGNIMQPCDLGRFDFILCRNVLIYFADSAIERVARVLFRLLLPGGCLFLGHSESLCRIATDFEMTQIDGLIVYRRPAAGEALP